MYAMSCTTSLFSGNWRRGHNRSVPFIEKGLVAMETEYNAEMDVTTPKILSLTWTGDNCEKQKAAYHCLRD